MLAGKIISERKRAGLNQEELADKLGVSRQAVEKSGYDALLERGDYSKAAKKANKAVDAVC